MNLFRSWNTHTFPSRFLSPVLQCTNKNTHIQTHTKVFEPRFINKHTAHTHARKNTQHNTHTTNTHTTRTPHSNIFAQTWDWDWDWGDWGVEKENIGASNSSSRMSRYFSPTLAGALSAVPSSSSTSGITTSCSPSNTISLYSVVTIMSRSIVGISRMAVVSSLNDCAWMKEIREKKKRRERERERERERK